KLVALKALAEAQMRGLDFIALPTIGTVYRVADIERKPLALNRLLGRYTNFVNFLGLSALALPAGFRPDGMPFGISLIGHPHQDRAVLASGARGQRRTPLPLGRTTSRWPSEEYDPATAENRLAIAVVGAHMNGLPLNGQLLALGGRLERTGRTAPLYRFYALPGGPPQRPGLLQV